MSDLFGNHIVGFYTRRLKCHQIFYLFNLVFCKCPAVFISIPCDVFNANITLNYPALKNAKICFHIIFVSYVFYVEIL